MSSECGCQAESLSLHRSDDAVRGTNWYKAVFLCANSLLFAVVFLLLFLFAPLFFCYGEEYEVE